MKRYWPKGQILSQIKILSGNTKNISRMKTFGFTTQPAWVDMMSSTKAIVTGQLIHDLRPGDLSRPPPLAFLCYLYLVVGILNSCTGINTQASVCDITLQSIRSGA